MAQPQMPASRNWRFEIDIEGIGWLTIDTPKAPVNTLSREAIVELDRFVERFEENWPIPRTQWTSAALGNPRNARPMNGVACTPVADSVPDRTCFA